MPRGRPELRTRPSGRLPGHIGVRWRASPTRTLKPGRAASCASLPRSAGVFHRFHRMHLASHAYVLYNCKIAEGSADRPTPVPRDAGPGGGRGCDDLDPVNVSHRVHH
jgi:hypothetical protein